MKIKQPGGQGAKGKFGNVAASTTKIDESYNIADKIFNQAKSIGISEPVRPTYKEEHVSMFPDAQVGGYFNGQLPNIVKNMTIEELGILYHLSQQWYAYVQYQHWYWQTKKAEANRKKEILTVRLRKGYESETTSDQKIRDSAKSDSQFIEADALYEESKAMTELLDTQVKIANKNTLTLSKVISIKESELYNGSRQRGFYSAMTRAARAEGPDEDANAEDPNQGGNPPRPAPFAVAKGSKPTASATPSGGVRKGQPAARVDHRSASRR